MLRILAKCDATYVDRASEVSAKGADHPDVREWVSYEARQYKWRVKKYGSSELHDAGEAQGTPEVWGE